MLRYLILFVFFTSPLLADPTSLVGAARQQVGVTTIYDPSYVGLEFPGGDVDPSKGVCTDVVIRAFRESLEIDLQLAVNRDMKANFSSYPKIWGLKTTDRNIDHRRVPNLQVLFARLGAEVTESDSIDDFLPGDLVTYMLPGNFPHIVIVSDRLGASGPMILHNIGLGAKEEGSLLLFEITGHYRFGSDALERLKVLGGV